MNNMKQIIVLCALIAGACGAWTGGLRVRFDVGLFPGKNFYYEVPRTVADAKTDGWTLTERPAGPLPSLVMYCPDDHILCALYDDTDFVAGLQVGLPQDDFTDSVLDWKTQGYTLWTPPAAADGTVKSFWTLQQYFVNEDTLKVDKSIRRLARNKDKTLQEDNIWVTGFNGELYNISTKAENIENSIFTKQACIPGMGRHFYYNTSSESSCTADAQFPWFALVNSGELVATGFVSFGKLPIKDGERNWFERPPTLAVKAIVPRGPQCLYDMSDSAGLVTMHIYYVDKPWLIGCLFQ